MNRPGDLDIKAIKDDDGIKEFILFRIGNYKEPIGVLSAYELRQLYKSISEHINKLGNQDIY